MHKQTAIAPFTSKFAAHVGIAVVNALLGAPFCTVRYGIPVDLARLQHGGKVNQSACIKGDLSCGNLFQTGQEETNARVLLQKLIDAIENSVLGAACKGHAVLVSSHAKAVVAREGIVIGNGDGVATLANRYTFFLQIFLQFFCGKQLGFGVAGCNQNVFQCDTHFAISFLK